MEHNGIETTIFIDDAVLKQVRKGRKLAFSLISTAISAAIGAFFLGRKVGKLEQKVDELNKKVK